jgi:hypothetical protein
MKTRIYIYLLDEGTDVWRPADAEQVGDSTYRITGQAADNTEKWQFKTGEIVRCREKIFSGGRRGLVAYEKVAT